MKINHILKTSEYLFLIGVFVLIQSGYAYANTFWSQTYNAQIVSIFEVDEIRNNDLYVDVAFELFLPQNFSQLFDNATIQFSPWFFSLGNGAPEILNYTICQGSIGGANYYFGGVTVRCNSDVKNASFIKENQPYANYNRPDYLITIPVDASEYREYTVKIMYKIPNFSFKEGNNYILAFSSSCAGYCNGDSWYRYVILPSASSVLVDYFGSFKILGKSNDDRWVFEIRGTENNPFIRYYDSNEVNFIEPLRWTFYGGIIGSIVAFFMPYSLKDFKKWIAKWKANKKPK